MLAAVPLFKAGAVRKRGASKLDENSDHTKLVL